MVKAYIDPGHGGIDPGAVGNSLYEKILTLKIALKIKEYLEEYEDVQIKMSRTGDQTRSLTYRTDDANAWGADVYVSPHINAGGGVGYEDFVYPGVGQTTLAIQDAIHNEVIKATGFNDRGQKQKNLHVLRESHMPAILTENGFIDNSGDAAKLKQDSFIDDVARGHVNGIVKAFNLRKKETSKPSKGYRHTVVKGDTLWSLSQKYGTTVNNLKKLNPGINVDALQIGSKLNITSGATYHTVKKGETVSELAKKYGSTIKQIRDWNKLDGKYTIYAGQQLRVN
ncbi:N-acetylmuramoyl-L-alanine amidase [Cytobacillus sp. OWB-43]|uniref:N-acetylmuramoyl-L-alanine amidase n=1 Tax=Cytobacillus sp. OWB-43 TaxID=3108468 RepID=UPI002AFE3388|nr:N-acetylmuramoyl-L-alanine amidase [Cytobacillus sp. OWB-43]MEA1855577.1 N-acetylmuramoyl-L-alanine amidase [Cytobacillus sp. OWB-43]